MELGLQGKLAVVTGASKGIGLAVTRALVDEGARVIAGARSSSDELDALSRTGEVRVVHVDLAEPAGPAALVSSAGDTLDVLVNNVGTAPEQVADSAVRSTATGRFTQPNEVADLVLLPVSQRTGNVTGTNVTIDRGLTTTL